MPRKASHLWSYGTVRSTNFDQHLHCIADWLYISSNWLLGLVLKHGRAASHSHCERADSSSWEPCFSDTAGTVLSDLWTAANRAANRAVVTKCALTDLGRKFWWQSSHTMLRWKSSYLAPLITPFYYLQNNPQCHDAVKSPASCCRSNICSPKEENGVKWAASSRTAPSWPFHCPGGKRTHPLVFGEDNQ